MERHSSLEAQSHDLEDVDSKSTPAAFRFIYLPAELRNKVYEEYFDLGETVHIIGSMFQEIAFYDSHKRLCPLNTHSVIEKGRSYSCQDAFTQRTKIIYAPPSRLCLLLVSKLIFQEAEAIFYSRNNLVFRSSYSLHCFIREAPSRFIHLTELTIKFSSSEATKAFNTLAKDCPHLTRLNILLGDWWNSNGSSGIAYGKEKRRCLKNAVGMKALLSLRGIKVLKISGNDRNPAGHTVNLDSVDSIGPLLRQQLMTPRVSDAESVPKPKRVHKARMTKTAVATQTDAAQSQTTAPQITTAATTSSQAAPTLVTPATVATSTGNLPSAGRPRMLASLTQQSMSQSTRQMPSSHGPARLSQQPGSYSSYPSAQPASPFTPQQVQYQPRQMPHFRRLLQPTAMPTTSNVMMAPGPHVAAVRASQYPFLYNAARHSSLSVSHGPHAMAAKNSPYSTPATASMVARDPITASVRSSHPPVGTKHPTPESDLKSAIMSQERYDQFLVPYGSL